jgi:hypothetical protein
MGLREKISEFMIKLEIGGEISLFLLMVNDGKINRMGTGEADNIEKKLFVGSIHPMIFSEFMTCVDEETLQSPGSFRLDGRNGKECQLLVMFKAGTESLKFEFIFNAESEGPPEDICIWIERAVEITDEWYELQKKRAVSKAS